MATIDKAEHHSEESCTNYDLDVPNSSTKRAGPFICGPKFGHSPAKCVSNCLARKEGTNSYFTIKILNKRHPSEPETRDDHYGGLLIQTEYALLSALKGEPGVIQQHGLFKDESIDEVENKEGELVPTGKMQSRLCLVLDCYTPHDFSPEFAQLTNLQFHVIKEKGLPEFEAIDIFYKAVQIVERVHKRNIIHRDLKIGNFIFNRDTREVKLTNFWLGKQLLSENGYVNDQKGSIAYVSPELIIGKPYLGKPSDMWSLGVTLYTMLYGHFPFCAKAELELFEKIKSGKFIIPVEPIVSQNTIELIQSLLVVNPAERLTASQALSKLKCTLAYLQDMKPVEFTHVVPDYWRSQPRKRPYDPIIEDNAAVAFTRPTATPVNQVEEAELDIDGFGNLSSDFQQYEDDESGDKDHEERIVEDAEVEIEQPPTKKIATIAAMVKHLRALRVGPVGLADSSILSVIVNEFGEQYKQNGRKSMKCKKFQRAAPSSVRRSSNPGLRKQKRSGSKMRHNSLVPSPSNSSGLSDEYSSQSTDPCDIDERLELSGESTVADASVN